MGISNKQVAMKCPCVACGRASEHARSMYVCWVGLYRCVYVGVGIGASGHVQECECLCQGLECAEVCVMSRLGHIAPRAGAQVSLQKDFLPEASSLREASPCSTG